MLIKNINSLQNFGKTPVMKCHVKKADSQEKCESTLYLMDTKNPSDIDEIRFSKTARCLYDDVLRDFKRPQRIHEFYLLKDDKTNEVISCYQTSHHYRAKNVNFPGTTTLVEELEGNIKYTKPTEPLFAYMAKNAIDRYDSSVSIGCYSDNESQFKQARFSKTKNGDWVLPEKRYMDTIDSMSKRHNIQFLI